MKIFLIKLEYFLIWVKTCCNFQIRINNLNGKNNGNKILVSLKLP
jgi:hypothetical protein